MTGVGGIKFADFFLLILLVKNQQSATSLICLVYVSENAICRTRILNMCVWCECLQLTISHSANSRSSARTTCTRATCRSATPANSPSGSRGRSHRRSTLAPSTIVRYAMVMDGIDQIDHFPEKWCKKFASDSLLVSQKIKWHKFLKKWQVAFSNWP